MRSLKRVSMKTRLLLVSIVGVPVFLGLKGVDATQIAHRVPLLMPQILLGVLLSLGLILFLMIPANAVWALPHPTKAMRDVPIGALVGGLLVVSYIFFGGPGVGSD